mmetsp:Transcript_61395/g.101887  ORF Transcript_61395/g.101887 Transcript_61395/m.101887 type:complete len:270 (+) Transcript_61395:57-866(+)
MASQTWEVVGGADKGGIIVREGLDTKSTQADSRLSTGALVKQLKLEGDRLQYERLTGTGPQTGWVSVKLKDKDLLVKTDKEPPAAAANAASAEEAPAADTIYDFEVELADGSKKKLDEYKSKVTVICNTASKCGMTPHYQGLQELYEKFGDRGLTVLGFPCNQFFRQEPGSNDDIQKFVKEKYSVTFPVFAKGDVNGAKALPLFQFLKESIDGPCPRATWAPKTVGPEEKDVKWNFTKFLCVDGKPTKRFSFDVEPKAMADDIEKALAA